MGKQKLPAQQRYSEPAAAAEHQPSRLLMSQQHLLPITFPEGTERGTALSSPLQHPALCGRTQPTGYILQVSQHVLAKYKHALYSLCICTGDTEQLPH